LTRWKKTSSLAKPPPVPSMPLMPWVPQT